jgi:2'-5' RNA ligase
MRLFLAATFPEAATRPLNERVARLKSRLPHASWVRPESQHLTFAFLGEQNEALLETLGPLVAASLAAVPRFEATLRGCGFFPNPRRARVGWIGAEPRERFVAVAQAVRGAAQRAGVTLDGGDFKPHLTLMRIRDAWPPASIALFESMLGDIASPAFALDGVTLYQSRLEPSGAIHTPIRLFPLAPSS